MTGREQIGSFSDDELDDLVAASTARLSDSDWDDLLAAPLPPLAPGRTGARPASVRAGTDVVARRTADDGVSSVTELASTRSARRRSLGWRMVPIALAAAVALVFVYVVRDPEPSIAPVSPSSTTTTVATPTTVPVLDHPAVPDRSLELGMDIADLGPMIREVTGESNSLSRSFEIDQQFSPQWFPDLAPLPTRATWVFTNPAGHPPGLCDRFVPAPPTMDGFAGVGFGSAATLVTVATYTFTDVASAEDFFAGRSLLLGASADECESPQGARRPTVRHRSFEPTPLPPGLDEWNSWTVSEPGDLFLDETAAFAFLGRLGDQLLEVRLGVVDPSTISRDDLGRLLGEVADRISAP